jgi:mRNA-degrading endonuclease RelE of RelBE toxin-antitoxin system
MAKKITWNERARADLRAIDQQTALHLLHALARFAATEEGAVKRLQGIEPPEFRLRVGDYRIRFYDHSDSLEILRVLNRRDAYR